MAVTPCGLQNANLKPWMLYSRDRRHHASHHVFKEWADTEVSSMMAGM